MDRKEYQKERRLRAKKLGLCSMCLTNNPTINMKTCKRCRDRQNKKGRENRKKGKCTSCSQKVSNIKHAKCDRCLKRRRYNHYKFKEEVINIYGGKCSCCLESSSLDFLTIDHINGGGAKHRNKLAKGKGSEMCGIHFYRWLKKNNYPDGFQVLCWNCNSSKHLGKGTCYHARANTISK